MCFFLAIVGKDQFFVLCIGGPRSVFWNSHKTIKHISKWGHPHYKRQGEYSKAAAALVSGVSVPHWKSCSENGFAF